jgi:hypothetical protein
VDNNKYEYRDPKKYPYPLIETENVPTGIVFVPVKIDDDGKIYRAQMMAGQIGYTVTGNDTVQPSSDWAIGLVNPE